MPKCGELFADFLRFARHRALQPNAVTDCELDVLVPHYLQPGFPGAAERLYRRLLLACTLTPFPIPPPSLLPIGFCLKVVPPAGQLAD